MGTPTHSEARGEVFNWVTSGGDSAALRLTVTRIVAGDRLRTRFPFDAASRVATLAKWLKLRNMI